MVLANKRERPRDTIYIATKAGRRLNPHESSGYNRENLTRFVERSLQNLQVDALDLLQLHCPPPDVYDRPEVFGVLEFFSSETKERDDEFQELVANLGRQFGQFVERQRAEAALRESEARLQLALSAGQMGVWEWNISASKITWSSSLEVIHGLKRGSFGACLMAEPGRVADAVAAMRAAVDVPVTVKCRIGIDDSEEFAFLARFVGSLS